MKVKGRSFQNVHSFCSLITPKGAFINYDQRFIIERIGRVGLCILLSMFVHVWLSLVIIQPHQSLYNQSIPNGVSWK